MSVQVFDRSSANRRSTDAAQQAALAVSVLPDDLENSDVISHVTDTLPKAHVVPIAFGPELSAGSFSEWLSEH
jgi:hypothetical protein